MFSALVFRRHILHIFQDKHFQSNAIGYFTRYMWMILMDANKRLQALLFLPPSLLLQI